jgi:hypothetical protein
VSGVTLEQAAAFGKLFDGRKDALGLDRGGVERLADGYRDWTRLYADHLRGLVAAGIGVFPVRDDETVLFAAIDLDEPNFELAAVFAGDLPGTQWIESSRSGNAHVWTFFDEPLECWAAKAVLRAACVLNGRPDVEVFPKQDGLREGMVGNYINLPFYGDTRPILNDMRNPESTLTLEEFLDYAEKRRSSAEEWRRRARALGASPERRAQGGEVFGERNSLHQCAKHIFDHREDNPLQVGHRAVVLFALAKMYANCRHYNEDETFDFVNAVNEAGEQAVPESEVRRFVANAYRGEFTSTGCDDPLMADYVSPQCGIARA